MYIYTQVLFLLGLLKLDQCQISVLMFDPLFKRLLLINYTTYMYIFQLGFKMSQVQCE